MIGSIGLTSIKLPRRRESYDNGSRALRTNMAIYDAKKLYYYIIYSEIIMICINVLFFYYLLWITILLYGRLPF
jgi:hypothetical protein